MNLPSRVLHGAQVLVANKSIVTHMYHGLLECLLSNPANVESPHRELRSGFTD